MESKKITANIPQVTSKTVSVDSSGRIIKEKPFKATIAEFLAIEKPEIHKIF